MRVIPILSSICLFVGLSLCLGSSAFATATLIDVGNSSNFDKTVTPSVIYGGTAGPSTGASGGSLFDNCAGLATLYPCNNRRIYPGAILTIQYKSDTSGGVPTIWYQGTASGSTTSSVALTPHYSSPTSAAAGQQTYVAVDWATICGALSADFANISAACDDSGAAGTGGARGTFRVGFIASTTDTTAQTDYVDVQIAVGGLSAAATESVVTNCADTTTPYGICAWEISPGDSKAVMTQARPFSGATGPTFNFKAVRVFYLPISEAQRSAPPYSSITAGTSTYSDLGITTSTSGDISLTPSRVTGLTNEQTYMFKIGMVDLAGNVGYYTANTTGPGNGIGDEYCENSSRVYSGSGNPNCHLATPGEVLGALSKPISCFIATAAYGSPMAPQVETFRKFRNQILLTNQFGQRFVEFYYEHSPKYAKIIAEHPLLRTLARATLWPFLGFAWLSLQLGSTWTMLLLLATIGGLALTLRRFGHFDRRPRV